MYTIIALLSGIIAAGLLLWYNVRKSWSAEANATTEKALRVAAENDAARAEAARREAEAIARSNDRLEASKVRESGSGRLAFDFLHSSFPKDRNDPPSSL